MKSMWPGAFTLISAAHVPWAWPDGRGTTFLEVRLSNAFYGFCSVITFIERGLPAFRNEVSPT